MPLDGLRRASVRARDTSALSIFQWLMTPPWLSRSPDAL